jgi:hypothetical protein
VSSSDVEWLRRHLPVWGTEKWHTISPSALSGHTGRHRPWIKRLVSYLCTVYTQNCCGVGFYRQFFPLCIFSSCVSFYTHSFPPIVQSLDLSHHIKGKNAVAVRESRMGRKWWWSWEEQSATRLGGVVRWELGDDRNGTVLWFPVGSDTDADTREEGVKENKLVGVRWKIILVIKSPPRNTSYNMHGASVVK